MERVIGRVGCATANVHDQRIPHDEHFLAPAHRRCLPGRPRHGAGSGRTRSGRTTGPRALKINEVESSDPSVADFVELVNNGATPAAVGGYVIKDNDDTHSFTIPAGTMIAAGGYYVADTDVAGGFGLGSADSARLFAPGAAAPIDSYSWTAHAATTYGRCPNGTGAFTTTTGSDPRREERCPGDVVALPWPGGIGRRHRRRRQRVRHEPQRAGLPAVGHA